MRAIALFTILLVGFSFQAAHAEPDATVCALSGFGPESKIRCFSENRSLDDLVRLAYTAKGFAAYDSHGEVQIAACYQNDTKAAAKLLVGSFIKAKLTDIKEGSIGSSIARDGDTLVIRFGEYQCTKYEDFAGEPACAAKKLVQRTREIGRCID